MIKFKFEFHTRFPWNSSGLPPWYHLISGTYTNITDIKDAIKNLGYKCRISYPPLTQKTNMRCPALAIIYQLFLCIQFDMKYSMRRPLDESIKRWTAVAWPSTQYACLSGPQHMWTQDSSQWAVASHQHIGTDSLSPCLGVWGSTGSGPARGSVKSMEGAWAWLGPTRSGFQVPEWSRGGVQCTASPRSSLTGYRGGRRSCPEWPEGGVFAAALELSTPWPLTVWVVSSSRHSCPSAPRISRLPLPPAWSMCWLTNDDQYYSDTRLLRCSNPFKQDSRSLPGFLSAVPILFSPTLSRTHSPRVCFLVAVSESATHPLLAVDFIGYGPGRRHARLITPLEVDSG